jgi:hypothetical protein
MKISSTALKAKRSCASGYRWYTRNFKSPAEYKSVIDALVVDGRVDDACWLLDQFGPVQSVLVVDDISAQAFVYAGSVLNAKCSRLRSQQPSATRSVQSPALLVTLTQEKL